MPASRQSRSEYAERVRQKGIATLNRDFSAEELTQTFEDAQPHIPGGLLIPIDNINENRDNPRKSMDDGPLRDLAASIAERGLLHPLVVRRDSEHPGQYVVVTGMRRLRASRTLQGSSDEGVRARVAQLPCIITQTNDRDAYADSLLENLARADLSRAETMDALHRLQVEFGWSGNYIAKRTGRNQSDIAELLRVAKEPRLAALVHKDALKPSVAGEITRLPLLVRDEVIAAVEAGTPMTTPEVKRRAAAATKSHADPAALPMAARDNEFIIPSKAMEGHLSAEADRAAVAARGNEFITSESKAPEHPGSVDMNRDAQPTVPDALADLRERLHEVDALAAGANDGTLAGQAVLIAVKKRIDVVYAQLATYIQRANQRDAGE